MQSFDVRKLNGWKQDTVGIQQTAREVGSIRQVARGLIGGERKDAYLFLPLLACKPNWRRGAQGIGDCVSWGAEIAVTMLMAIDAVAGTGSWVEEAATESIYGGCRVEVLGKTRGGRSDGAFGYAAAKWLKEWGVILRTDYSKDTGNREHDLRKYDAKKAKEWGDYGCGGSADKGKLDEVAKLHPVEHIAQVKTVEEAIAALQNYYPITIASMAGFGDMKRDAEGMCYWVNQWAHQMCTLPDAIIAGESFKPAKNVNVGDKVYSRDGKLHKVTEVFKRHHKGVLVRINLCSGIPLEVTEDHPVLVYRRVKNRKEMEMAGVIEENATLVPKCVYQKWRRFEPVWVTAAEIRPGDCLCTPPIEIDGTEEIPWNTASKANLQPKATHLTPTLAYLFGFYAGDGCVRKKHGIEVVLGLQDDLSRIVEAFRELGFEPSISHYGKYIRVRVNNATLRDSFAEWFGGKCHEKQFPSWLMKSKYAKEIVEGFRDADGCVYKTRNQIVSTSLALLQQVRMLLVRLGFGPNLYEHDNTGGSYANARRTWIISWYAEPKRNDVYTADGYRMNRVKSVLHMAHEGEVYNFEVEDTHDYIADGYVVHNCLGAIKWVNGKPRFRVFQSWGDSCSGDDPDIADLLPKTVGSDGASLYLPSSATNRADFIRRLILPDEAFPYHVESAADWNPISACSWWIDERTLARILQTGDCWSIAGVKGFEPRKLNVKKAVYDRLGLAV